MASQAQIAANRHNAAKSTGPRTEAGKAASSRNGLKHGMTARSLIIFDESWEDFSSFGALLRADYEPQGAAEEEIVERIVMAAWCLRRAWRAEAAALDKAALPAAEHRAWLALKDEIHANPPPGLDLGDDGAVRDLIERRRQALPRDELMAFAADAGRPRPAAWPDALVALTRYQAHYERMLTRAQAALQRLRSERKREEEERRAAAHARAEAAEFEALLKRGLRQPNGGPEAPPPPPEPKRQNYETKPIPPASVPGLATARVALRPG